MESLPDSFGRNGLRYYDPLARMPVWRWPSLPVARPIESSSPPSSAHVQLYLAFVLP